MKDQDTLYNQIKEAVDHAESPGFDAMEKVWQRVEEKLEAKTLKKENNLWKKIAVAASLLLFITLGYHFFDTDSTPIPSKETVTQIDSLQKSLNGKKGLAEADTAHPAIKKDAAALLQKQLTPRNQMAYQAVTRNDLATDTTVYRLSIPQLGSTTLGYTASDKVVANWSEAKKDTKDEVIKGVEVFIDNDTRVSSTKKESPLVVIDDKATNLQSLQHLNTETIDSLEILNDPIYIINGIYYTEKELFGPNPTSPYTPLDQQDIETISILKDEKAVALYGEKGKKGVVIIHTKEGKPKAKNTTKPNLDKSKWTH